MRTKSIILKPTVCPSSVFWRPYGVQQPEHIHKWIGCPLLLLKALYGYNYSGKFLYQDQAKFLIEQGMVQIMPGFWIKHLPNDKIHMFLHYVNDIYIVCVKQQSIL